MADLPAPLQAVLADPQHLSGTNVQITLPVSRYLLNEVLAARPANTPLEAILLDPEEGNLARLHLAIQAPVIGAVKRRLTLRPGGPVSFPGQPWLQLDIVDGFRLLDKPIIKLMQGQIDERLPRSLQITTNYLRLHVPALLRALEFEALIPLVKRLQLSFTANQLVITLHIVAP